MAEADQNKPETEKNSSTIHLIKEGINVAYTRKINLGTESIYCFDCQKAFVSKEEHPDSLGHKTYLRHNYYNYDENLFAPTQDQLINYIENIPKYKEDAIKETIQVSEKLQEELKTLKEEKIEEINNHYDIIAKNLRELLNYYTEARYTLEKYFKDEDYFFGIHEGNMERENSLFLMNFEQIEGYKEQVARINKEITDSENLAKGYCPRIVEEFDETFKKIKEILELKISLDKFDNYFKESNIRTDKYIHHNELFRKAVANVNDKYGNINHVKEAINSFDAKIKIGVDYLFTQDFFVEGENPDNIAPKPRKLIKANVENNINSILNSNKKENEKNDFTPSLMAHAPKYAKSNKKRVASCQKTNTPAKKVFGKTNLIVMSDPKMIYIDSNKITLANPILQRYFSYSFYSYYNKTFADKPEREVTSSSKNLLLDYARRMKLMKDYTKPVPGTNKLNVFNSTTKKLSQIEVELKGEIHGYNIFPEGCRSILINGQLYITGGKDDLGNPLAYVNSVDLNKGLISARPPMLIPHAYHTIEYLHNYDCFVVIGGKDGNNNCEIYDIYGDKWHRLPKLNLPRYNCNCIYNGFTGEIYVLFGMLDNGRNSDVLEVLELKDIKGGWIKMDYEKNAVLDLQVNYCKVAQFDSEKLLIYGANDSRDVKKKYAFYDSDKNEMIKVENEEDKKEISLMEKDGKPGFSSPRNSTKSISTLNSARSTNRKLASASKTASAKKLNLAEGIRKFDYLGSNSVFK